MDKKENWKKIKVESGNKKCSIESRTRNCSGSVHPPTNRCASPWCNEAHLEKSYSAPLRYPSSDVCLSILLYNQNTTTKARNKSHVLYLFSSQEHKLHTLTSTMVPRHHVTIRPAQPPLPHPHPFSATEHNPMHDRPVRGLGPVHQT